MEIKGENKRPQGCAQAVDSLRDFKGESNPQRVGENGCQESHESKNGKKAGDFIFIMPGPGLESQKQNK